MTSWIILLILVMVPCLTMYIISSDYGFSPSNSKTEDDGYHYADRNDELNVIPYQTIQGGTSAGGIMYNNSTNHYGVIPDQD